MIKIQNQSEEIESINPRMTLEEMDTVAHMWDTVQSNREAREKRDMARFGRIGEETSNTDYNFGNDLPSRGELDNGRY